MVFHRVTLYSKYCNINPLIKNKYFSKGTSLYKRSYCTVDKDIKKKETVSVADYYNGKSIFITGGTGFLGKTYIQKILYSCPNINRIYMLVRASSKEAAEHRITEMVEDSTQLFNNLKEERPQDLEKLVPIVGDLSAPNLGIHPDEELLLQEELYNKHIEQFPYEQMARLRVNDGVSHKHLRLEAMVATFETWKEMNEANKRRYWLVLGILAVLITQLEDYKKKSIIESKLCIYKVIVHSAATINITETLQDAFQINVTGTQNLLDLAKRMKNLQAFLHISTLYCALTAGKEVIEETVNPPPINPNDIKKTLAKYGHMRLPPENVLAGYRNTYLFTKALSESMVQLNHAELPTAIIRPSLIGSSNIEPYKGWIDIMNIHSFLMYAAAVGHIRVLNIEKKTVWDFIPVDYVANLMILAATKCKRSTDIDVYNCATSSVNPVKISKAISIFISDFLDNKSNKLPFPFVFYIKSRTLFRLLTPILQLTPAHVDDLYCLFTGQKPKSVKSYRKLMDLSDNIQFYGGRSWRAKPDKVLSLITNLNDEDRRNFPCDPNDIEWFEYFQKYSEGVRKYILKNKKK